MKHVRRMLGILLTLAMLFTMLSVAWSVSAVDYKTGDTVLFGTFPQSEVKDTKLMGHLADVQMHWNSAGYYSGTGSWDDGKMVASDYMQYADFVYEGKAYRAIKSTKYRPSQSGGEASPTNGNGSGYSTDLIYYFKFEPIEWIVLDAANGLLMSKNVLDAQPYQNLVKKSGSDYKTGSSYANNYEKSSLRAYLTGPFYKAAFSRDQKSAIVKKAYCWAAYNSSATTPTVTDTVTVLSYQDCQKTAYGFSNTINADTARIATGYSDYAKSQGLLLSGEKADWWLRTPDTASGQASCVDTTGRLNHAATVNLTNKGVRPVISVSAIAANTEVSLLTCLHNNGTTAFPAVAATCEKAGHTYYEICNECSAVCNGENNVIPATGHVDKMMRNGDSGADGWCDVCGAELTLHLDNSGSLQLSGPLQSVMDMIRKLVARIESLFSMFSKDDDKGSETEPTTETPSSSSTTVDLSSTGSALDSFANILGTMIDSFRGISDQKSAEKEADRNNFMDFLSNWANS